MPQHVITKQPTSAQEKEKQPDFRSRPRGQIDVLLCDRLTVNSTPLQTTQLALCSKKNLQRSFQGQLSPKRKILVLNHSCLGEGTLQELASEVACGFGTHHPVSLLFHPFSDLSNR